MKCIYFVVGLLLYGCKSSIEYPDKGYDYPSTVDSKDSLDYIYHLKKVLSPKDSFNLSNYFRALFIALNEPNLGIRPMTEPTYRLLYTSSMDKPVAITLTETKIVVKEGIKGYGNPYYDTSKLSTAEKFHFKLFEEYYPIKETMLKKYTRYFDSLINIYPELLNVKYYQSLMDKSLSFGEDSFQYTVKTIPISRKTFAELINKINSSDYWDEPFHTECMDPPNDGFGFTLEANTTNKYKIVEGGFCPGYKRNFHKAWQALINYAQLDNRKPRISLIWDDY